eukprot:TRINITY_DN74125_c0_g1_i1.p1 TRINITY_DN74125_c0_g1~~TRINITY_DN74125_c0_g1_i1.p1  ORF type:complete len:721 (+),score=344.28 TRINITY_DN74125_c0_g1_i1:52-2214(+)
MPPATRPLEGIEFPKDAEGERKTTAINQGTFAAAVRGVDPAAAEQVEKARGWRFGYVKHVVNQVKLAVQSEENAYKIAEDGEKYLHNKMMFVRGEEMPLSEAMDKFRDNVYKTAVVKGKGQRAGAYTVPYQGKRLQGSELAQQVETWVRQGVIELSCGASIMKVAQNPGWTDLSDQYFVLFGAASAMGPFPLLMDMGANVIALDLDREGIWKKLLEKTRSSPGTLIFPVSEDPAGKSDDELAKVAGCNLLTKTPEVRTWLVNQYPDKQLVCGAYAYLDGPLFVKVSVAMDAIIKDLVKTRKVKPALAYLCTPTDAHVVPNSAMAMARQQYNRKPMWQGLCEVLLSFAGGKFKMAKNFSKPVEGTEHSVVDAIVADQGPNYILAKRLQHWRAILSRRDGCIVSTNIAPSTATKSVVSNKMFALAYQGMHNFKPVEVFYEDTSNAVMTALMLADLNDTTSAANPQSKLANPMCLFSDNSFHGGAWRCAYKFGAIGTPSVLSALWSSYVVTPYMTLYNFTQAAGWGYALTGLLQHEAAGTGMGLWAKIGGTVTFFQYLAGLELVHSLLGLTRSGFMTTLVQLLSRFFVVAVLNETPSQFAADNMFIRMMLFAWSLTEVIRYTFYGTPVDIAPLTWLRYTLFIVLYPMGVTGEIGCLNIASQSEPTSSFGVMTLLHAFYKFGGLPLLIFGYVTGLYGLYTHMLAQRSKVLGRGSKKASAEKKNN